MIKQKYIERLLKKEEVLMTIFEARTKVKSKYGSAIDLKALKEAMDRRKEHFKVDEHTSYIPFCLFPEKVDENNILGIIRNPVLEGNLIRGFVTLSALGIETMSNRSERYNFSIAFTSYEHEGRIVPVEVEQFNLRLGNGLGAIASAIRKK